MTYALIGEKLEHSYSKIIHEMLSAYSYDLIPIAPEKVGEFIKKRHFKGLNVTIPYKQTVMEYCDKLSPIAEQIGAVNTMYFDSDGILWGTNTDYTGFIYALELANIKVNAKNILILGNGATCKTIRKALSDLGAFQVYIASRKVEKIKEENEYNIIPYRWISSISDKIDVVINATPVGMYPNTEKSPCDLRIFSNCKDIFDVIYNPNITKFMAQGQALGMNCAGGLAMLVAQATASAGYFTGKGNFFEKENLRIIEKFKCVQELFQ